MKDQIKIEKGVPLPTLYVTRNNYPVERLKARESFLAPKNAKPASFRAAVFNKAKALGFKVTVRQTPEGLRCWRIE